MPYERAATDTDATGSERSNRGRQVGEDLHRDEAEQDADHEADPELLHHQEHEVVDPERRIVDPLDQPDRERDRCGIVEARLALERPGELAPNVSEAHRREDRSGVGRRNDATEQDCLRPGEVEQLVRREAGQQRRHRDADRAQERRGDRDPAHAPPRGREAALVEDRDEADDADRARELRVVELDPARPVGPEQHPESDEGDECGDTGPRRAEPDEDARGEHAADDQQEGPGFHALSSLLRRNAGTAARASRRPLPHRLGLRRNLDLRPEDDLAVLRHLVVHVREHMVDPRTAVDHVDAGAGVEVVVPPSP